MSSAPQCTGVYESNAGCLGSFHLISQGREFQVVPQNMLGC